MAEQMLAVPTIVLAGTGSGCGKTTLTCALLGALVRRNLQVQPFKCGPDYIDPGHHTRITGRPSRNLDSFLLEPDTLRYLFWRAAADANLALVEGVMGYYDGLGGTALRASTHELAGLLAAPTILVVNCRGMSLSAAAVVRGFSRFVAESRIAGVILNNTSPGLYRLLRRPIEEQAGVPVLGHLPKTPEGSFADRHLGLVTAAEVGDFDARVARLASVAADTIDLDAVVRLAGGAAAFQPPPSPLAGCAGPGQGVTVAVAQDEAFCFYYQDNLDLLRLLGADLVGFSPLRDESLPPGCAGLWLGGGYPELHAAALEGNEPMRRAVRAAANDGMPVFAECGGFLYLLEEYRTAERSYQMAGVLDGHYRLTGRLGRFGYQELAVQRDNLLAPSGTVLRAHEFHYAAASSEGADLLGRKPGRPDKTWPAVHAGPNIFAGFPHLHFWSDPQLAVNYLAACARYGAARDGGETVAQEEARWLNQG